ncbi:ParB/RepB/Spo0J family partition protein [Kiloniella sp.]|uniref:ParB/RepB/Spo0J family partition protein n=1 Tax=Kiloniella sp. TaxID=1938587 RepID=UPI003B02E8AA
MKYGKKQYSLDKLVISEHNVRTEATQEGSLEKLKLSIKTAGLINPLTVFVNDGSAEVICGGRRFSALQELQEAGDIDKSYKVECRIVPEGVDITKVSLMENVVREPMKPSEEFEAFHKLSLAGMSVEEIAHDFGTTVRHVEQRLRLATIAPEIFESYKKGDITLDILKAFGATDNQERQLAYFRENTHFSEYQIKKAMQVETYKTNHRFARFVGLKAYEGAGGLVERDLFSSDDDVLLISPEILERLVDERMEQVCSKYREAGWSFAERVKDSDEILPSFDRKFYPERAELSKEELVRMDEIAAELEVLDEQGNFADETMVRDLLEEYRELEEKCDFFSPEEKAASGVVVVLDWTGEISVERGLVRRCEEEADIDTSDCDEGDRSSEEASDASSVVGYSGVVLDRLTAMRAKCFQADLARNPDLARDFLLYSLVIDTFRTFVDKPLAISLAAQGERLDDVEIDATPAQGVLSAIHEKFEKLFSVEDGELRSVVFGLSETDKVELLSYCVGCSFKAQLGVRRPYTGSKSFEHNKGVSEAEVLLGTDIREGWSPTSESFLSRLSTKKLLEIGAEIVDDNWALSRSTEKKINLAHAIARLFDPDNASLSAEQRARAAKWLPQEMINQDMVCHNLVIPAFVSETDEEVAEDISDSSDIPDYLQAV